MWQHISNTFCGFIAWRCSLASLILLLLVSIQGCAVTASFSPLKADRLYHSGRYEDLIRHIESTFPEQERRRILTENESRIAANESTTFELIKYHFFTRYLIYSLIECGFLEDALRRCDIAIEDGERLSRLFRQFNYVLHTPIECNNKTLWRLRLYKQYIIWFKTGDLEQASKFPSRIELESLPPKERIYLLLDRGFFYDKIVGNYPKALVQFQQVLHLTQTLGVLDVDSKYAFSLQAYRRIILIYIKLGKLAKARQTLDEYESLSRDICFRLGKAVLSSNQYFRGYLSMMDATAGALFATAREFDRSKQYFEKAWAVLKRIDPNSTHMWDRNALGVYYALYGAYYLGLQNRYGEASKYIDRAISYQKPYYIEAIQAELDIETVYVYSAELHLKNGNAQMALAQGNKALEYSERYHNRITAARALTLIGQIHLDSNQNEEATKAFERALKLVGNADSTENWKLYFSMGQLFERSKKKGRALDLYRKAVNEVEKLWDERFKDVQKQLSFVGDRLTVYEPVIRLLADQNRDEDAVAYMERSKSRTFYEASNLWLEGEQGAEKNHIASPRTPATEFYSEPLTVPETRNLLPSDTVLLEYYVGRTVVVAAVISAKKGVHVTRLQISTAELIELVGSFRKAVEYPVGGKYKELGAQLYDALVRPLERFILGYYRLGIVPHGVLHYLPFHALIIDTVAKSPQSSVTEVQLQKSSALCLGPPEPSHLAYPVFLLERYAVFYAPSATILGLAQQINPMKRNSLLAVGSPPSTDVNCSGVKTNTYKKLCFAEVEVNQVRKFFEEGTVLIDAEATETAIKKEAGKYDILLFSVHGALVKQKPLESCLLLASDRRNDGRLSVTEIGNIHFSANLTVLSACQTGLVLPYTGIGITEGVEETNIPLGDDMFGLQRAFIKSGSASVLSTLWTVDSKSTASLIVAFFEKFKAGDDKATALRSAQMDLMRANGDWAHPYYWAPFFLCGDWR